jgi:hypothetical protein
MASNTKIVSIRRKNKAKNLGKKRKQLLDKIGTTPKFPIHPETK